MSLASLIASAPVTLTLALDGHAISSPVSASSWEQDGDSLRTTVEFGPFVEHVTVGAVWVSIAGGEPTSISPTDDGSEFTLPAGMPWEFTFSILTSSRQVK